MISHSQTIQTLAQASQLAKDIEASFRSSLDHIFILKAGEQYSVPNDIVDDSKVVEDVYVSPEVNSVIYFTVVESCIPILDEIHEFFEVNSDDVDVRVESSTPVPTNVYTRDNDTSDTEREPGG